MDAMTTVWTLRSTVVADLVLGWHYGKVVAPLRGQTMEWGESGSLMWVLRYLLGRLVKEEL